MGARQAPTVLWLRPSVTELRIYVSPVARWTTTVKTLTSNVCLAVVENGGVVGIINVPLARYVNLILGNVWRPKADTVKRVVIHKRRAVVVQRPFV